jgi:hypothetical protein
MMLKKINPVRTMITSITNILLNQRNAILQEWLRQQLAAQNLRADLVSEAELRKDSNQFLQALSEAGADWQPD